MQMADLKSWRKDCTLCPRNCHADRSAGQLGFCRSSDRIRAARAALHYWEEPCISGEDGSGAVFFSGCSLGCVYCQNRPIAEGSVGKEISAERLAEIFLELQGQGAWNINLITAAHFVPQVAESLRTAKSQGLKIPVVYNSSGYEKVETLKLLEGLVDIYLPDLKYLDPALAKRYSSAPDYPQAAKAALAEMVRQAGRPVFAVRGKEENAPGSGGCGMQETDAPKGAGGEENLRLLRGVIVRHLVLPGQTEASKEVIRYLYETYGDQIYISILNQYTPMPGVGEAYLELGRKLTQEEYDSVVDYAIETGVENGFIQEGETASESFIPAFDITGI